MGLVLATCMGSIAKAQCGKHFTITTSRTEYIDSTGELQREEDENSTVEVSGSEIHINPGNDGQHIMKGKIKTTFCNWQVPYKEGKSIIKGELENEKQEVKAATLILEGKDGKQTAVFYFDAAPNRRIRLPLDSFKEK